MWNTWRHQDIREQKKSLLVPKYEYFKLKSHENIDKMFCRFIDIVKDLELLGKKYILDEKNRNILNGLWQEYILRVFKCILLVSFGVF